MPRLSHRENALLDRQEELLGKELGVLDYSALVAAVARHRVNTPQLHVGSPDTHWRAAALMEQIVLLRLASPQRVLRVRRCRRIYQGIWGSVDTTAYEPWRDLIADIRALRLTVYDIADRLRSMRPPE